MNIIYYFVSQLHEHERSNFFNQKHFYYIVRFL